MGHPSEMYWDKKTSGRSKEAVSLGKKRSAEAGCTSNNRCSEPPYEEKYAFECDEFPFKSTDPSRAMSKKIPAINRCVPSRHNKCKSDHNLTQLGCALILTLLTIVQGNALKQFYESTGPLYKNGGGLHKQEGWYNLAFQGYAGINYCEDASTRDCKNGMLTLEIGRLR